jgi:hypothetical protein
MIKAFPICTAVNICAAIAVLVLAATLHSPPQSDNAEGLARCMKLHPERYCRLTFFPSSIKP